MLFTELKNILLLLGYLILNFLKLQGSDLENEILMHFLRNCLHCPVLGKNIWVIEAKLDWAIEAKIKNLVMLVSRA